MKKLSLSLLVILISNFVSAACTEYEKAQYRTSIQNFKDSYEQCYPNGVCAYVKNTGIAVPSSTPGIFYEVWGLFYTGLEDPAFTQQFSNCSLLPIIQPPPPPPITCQQSGSVIHPHTQVLGEEIPLVGSSFKLNYFTNRVRGRAADYNFNLQVSESYIDSDLVDIDLKITDMSEQTIYVDTTFPPTANQNYMFSWTNPTGFAGKKMKATYRENFASTNIERFRSFIIGDFRAEILGLGGWYPSQMYYYDHDLQTLYEPDGTNRSVVAKLIPNTSESFVADEDGELVHIFNAEGFHLRTVTGLLGSTVVSFQYLSNRSLDRITERDGRFTQFNRNVLGQLTSITSASGKTTSVSLTSDGYLASLTDPLSKTYSMTYMGSDGILATFRKPTLELSTFTYDADKNLTKDEHSGGKWSTLTKTSSDEGNAIIQFQTRMGLTSTFTNQNISSGITGQGSSLVSSPTDQSNFQKTDSTDKAYYAASSEEKTWVADPRFGDQVQNLSTTNMSRNNLTKSDYFAQSTSLSDPLNPWSIVSLTKTRSFYDSSSVERITTTSFNPTNRTWTTTTPMGRTSTSILDTDERVTSIQKGNLNPITFTYEMDQIKTESHTANRVTTYNYDSTTRLLTSVVNPLSQSTYYSYDNNERLIAQTFPDLKMVQYSYDDLGRKIGVTPPSRPQHVFTFNSQEQMGTYLAPTQTQSTSYAYDFDNRMTSMTKPSGAVVSYNYDSTYHFLNQIVSPNSTITYTRSAPTWNPATIAHSGGFNVTQTFAGEMLDTQSLYDPAANFLGSMQTNYNDRELIASQVLTDKNYATYTVNRTYNADEMLTQVGSMTLGYSAMPNGLLNKTTIQTLIENITQSNFEEITNRNVKKGTATLFAEDLIRDNLGRITQRVMAITGWPTVTFNYVYDDRGRLTEVQDASLNWVRRYTYDDNGNRLTLETASPLSTVTSTTNSQDQLTSSGVYTFTYNLNGELQTKTNTFLNQTTTYAYDDFGNLVQVVLENGDVIAYEIDGLNRRVGKKKNNVLIERYLWNEDKLIAELNANGTIKRRYIYVTKSHVPDYYVEGSTNYKIVTDSLGSPVLVLKASDGAVTQRIEYDEFGRVLQDSRSGELVISYAGGVGDWDTKLVRFGARDYDPSTGRWLSKDPILFEGGDENLYGYVESDPVNFVDPTGNFAIVLPVLGLPGVGSAAAAAAAAGAAAGTAAAIVCQDIAKDEKDSCWSAMQSKISNVCSKLPFKMQGKCISNAAIEYTKCLKGSNK